MTKHILNDEKMARMYNTNVLIEDIAWYFGVDRRTIYRHLATQGIYPNRKPATVWTPREEMQLIDAHRSGVTGQEYEEWVPTRTKTACKGHLRKLRM